MWPDAQFGDAVGERVGGSDGACGIAWSGGLGVWRRRLGRCGQGCGAPGRGCGLARSDAARPGAVTGPFGTDGGGGALQGFGAGEGVAFVLVGAAAFGLFESVLLGSGEEGAAAGAVARFREPAHRWSVCARLCARLRVRAQSASGSAMGRGEGSQAAWHGQFRMPFATSWHMLRGRCCAGTRKSQATATRR